MAVPARPVECVDKVDEGGLAIFRKGLKGHSLRIRVVNVGSVSVVGIHYFLLTES
jgi:hypothetical protein